MSATPDAQDAAGAAPHAAQAALPVVAALFTGGTISMRLDEAAGGAVPSLSAQEILAHARGIDAVAEVRAEQWARLPGPHFTVAQQWALRARVAELLADDGVAGVVITHGTDTLEETAYLLARSLPRDKPVVFTGAMRAASDLGYDGPQNLIDAVRVAAHPDARGQGALVCMGGEVLAALEDTKSHTHHLSAFEAPGLGPVAILDDDRVLFQRALRHVPPPLAPERLAEPVDIVATWAGCDARLLDASRESGARGIVIAAMGRGNVPPAMVPGVERCIAAGVPVVIASRAGRGHVGRTYAYPGGGRKLHDLGAIFAGQRRPQQARVELMLALGGGLSGAALRVLFEG